MAQDDIVAVVQKWRETYLSEGKFLRETAAPGAEEEGYVQIFEVSNKHVPLPHIKCGANLGWIPGC